MKKTLGWAIGGLNPRFPERGYAQQLKEVPLSLMPNSKHRHVVTIFDFEESNVTGRPKGNHCFSEKRISVIRLAAGKRHVFYELVGLFYGFSSSQSGSVVFRGKESEQSLEISLSRFRNSEPIGHFASRYSARMTSNAARESSLLTKRPVRLESSRAASPLAMNSC